MLLSIMIAFVPFAFDMVSEIYANHDATCNFEDATLCGWTNARESDGQLDWTLHQGPTSALLFLTVRCGNFLSGHYVYIESSLPVIARANDTALLVSPVLTPTPVFSHGCLTFWYNMHGSTIGRLAVFLVDAASKRGILV
ncbi:hypothetical protein BaRGS_00017296 [Batillaria attramentaria]|uniref:MAM domain-containing protein n=1 Tax=Batillaria attramentaria TaxID=370345 RepID=A0ABD0KWJ1_9CAEN